MSFLRDTAADWFKQKEEAERLGQLNGPLSPGQDYQQQQARATMDGGFMQHAGQGFVDHMKNNTLGGRLAGLTQPGGTWAQAPQQANRHAVPQMLAPGQSMNAPQKDDGKMGLLAMMAKMYGGG